MNNRDIVVIGASAGGVEALQDLVRSLPPTLPAAVFVVLHFPEHGTSVLPRILSRAGPMTAIHAVDCESIVRGRIYVAPPDHHLLLDGKVVRVIRGPRENGNRPAIDPLFRSAAIAYGPRVIGVVLTGNLDDGTSGLAAIKRRGGFAVVQDPEDALFPSMPRSALENVRVDRVVPIRQLAKILIESIKDAAPSDTLPVSQSDLMENELSAGNLDAIEHPEQHPGRVSAFSCPDCGGVLWEIHDGEFTRFRCRVGHAWTGDALYEQQSNTFEDALWTALRSLEENASLSRQIAAKHRARQSDSLAKRFDAQAEFIEKRAEVIRASLSQDRVTQSEPADERVDPRRAS
ncbi:MAG TPA: chemotaxis protein CheB [Gemmatimonadaceae bacterium]|jgi:two-component system chemotaxis response regulator CheB